MTMMNADDWWIVTSAVKDVFPSLVEIINNLIPLQTGLTELQFAPRVCLSIV